MSMGDDASVAADRKDGPGRGIVLGLQFDDRRLALGDRIATALSDKVSTPMQWVAWHRFGVIIVEMIKIADQLPGQNRVRRGVQHQGEIPWRSHFLALQGAQSVLNGSLQDQSPE